MKKIEYLKEIEKLILSMVGAAGFEPATPTMSP